VITQFADTQWEVNGLFDDARRPKADPVRLRAVNADDVAIALLDRPRTTSGGVVGADVVVSHFSAADLARCTLEWSVPELGVDGTIAGGVEPGGVTAVGRLEIPVPDLEAGVEGRLILTLCDGDGEVRGRGETPLPLFVRPAPVRDVRVRAVGDLRLRLEREGWATGPADGADVAIDDRWDELRPLVEAGGRAVLLASNATALPSDANVEVRAREGTIWQGHWAQGLSWVRPSLLEGLPVGPRVGTAWTDLTPEHVLAGYTPADRADVLGGSYLGWLRGHVATIAGFRAGRGVCLVCTFPLAHVVGSDPLATELLARLVRLTASPAFAPAKPLW
jgi:hypothetical protein